jgi:hypothetical protein
MINYSPYITLLITTLLKNVERRETISGILTLIVIHIVANIYGYFVDNYVL